MSTPAVVDIQLKDIDLKGGVNESFRKEALDWTKYFTKVENLVIDDYGSLVKRPGRGQMAGTLVQDDNGNGLMANAMLRAYQLPGCTGASIVGDGSTTFSHNLYQYNESKDTLTKIGTMPEYSVDQVALPPSQHNSSTTYAATQGTGVECTGAVKVNGYYVVATKIPSANGNAYLTVMDATSGTVVRQEIFSNATSRLHLYLCAVGNNVHVYESGAATGNFYQYTTSNLTLSTPTALGAAGIVQAAISLPDGSGSVCAIINAATTFQKFSNVGVSAGTVGLANTFIHDMSCSSSSVIYASGIDTVSLRARIARYSSALAHQGTVTDAAGPTTYDCVRIAVDSAGNDARVLCYRNVAVGTHNACSVDIYQTNPTAAVLTTYWGTIAEWSEASLPFYNSTNGRYYVSMTKVGSSMIGIGGGAISYTRETTGRSSLIDISFTSTGVNTESRFRPVASLGGYTNLNNLGDNTNGGAIWPSGVITHNGSAPRPHVEDSGKTVLIPTTFQNTATSIGHMLNVLRLNSAYYLGNADRVLSGGLVAYQDSQFCWELGFLDKPTVIASQGAAGGPAAGSRSYVAVFEYIGADGNVHYSQTSGVCNWTNTGGNQITLNVIPPTVTGRDTRSMVRCVIYRTVANGTAFYLLTVLTNPVSSAGVITYTAFNDTIADADLAARPIMYRQPGTAGAALDRHAPLSSQAICQHKDRVFTALGSNVYYSSFKVDGEAPWFNPAFSFYVPGGTGQITGLASMDGNLFIFKRDGIWAVDGDGPPENGGTGAEFTTPRRLRTEFGCTDQRTVVVTPAGIMYRSQRGIELLQPNGNVAWIGESIKNTVDAYPYVGGACVDRTGGRVMFPFADAEGHYPGTLKYDGLGTQNGITAVYDLSAGCWTTAIYYGQPGESGAYVQDYVYGSRGGQRGLISLGAAGFTFHDPDSCLDNGGATYVPFTLETGWIKADSMQDRIRVTDLLILAKKVTNHNLTVSVAYDYSDTYSYSKTWTPADINGLSLEQLELQAPKQLVQAMRFKITDSEPADTATYPITTGKGPEILGLTVKYGLKGGGAKLASGSKG
jgi:hypothetical protein